MGETDDLEARAKEAAGALSGNDELKREGQAEQMAEKAKGLIDQAKDKITEVFHKRS